MRHEIKTEQTPFGHKAVCVCGGFTLGFFTSATSAKRAGMNCSHGDEQPQNRRVENGNLEDK